MHLFCHAARNILVEIGKLLDYCGLWRAGGGVNTMGLSYA